MGANVCKSLGISTTKTIGTKDVENLWNGYTAKNKNKDQMTYKQAFGFLADLSKQLQIPFTKNDGKEWLKHCGVEKESDILEKSQFLKLLYEAIKTDDKDNFKADISQSLATTLLPFNLELPPEVPDEPQPEEKPTKPVDKPTKPEEKPTKPEEKPTKTGKTKDPKTKTTKQSGSSSTSSTLPTSKLITIVKQPTKEKKKVTPKYLQ